MSADAAIPRANPSAAVSRRGVFLAGAGIALAALVAYFNCFSGPFIFDDPSSIVANPTIRHLWPPWAALQPPPVGVTAGGRPVLNFSLALNYAAGGVAVRGYHAGNLAIHLMAALALFGLVRRTLLRSSVQVRINLSLTETGRTGVVGAPLACRAVARWRRVGAHGRRQATPLQESVHLESELESGQALPANSGFAFRVRQAQRPEPAEGQPQNHRLEADATFLAFVVAALWAVHPLQTESITYVIQRAESLMGMFYLLTLYAFVRGAESPVPTGWFALSAFACLLGMGTKEVMVSAPVLVLLYDRTFLAGSFAAAWRQRWKFYVALASTWLWLGYLVASTGGDRGGSAGFGVGVGWWDYLLTQFKAITVYLRLALWPQSLIFEYGTFWIDHFADVLPSALLVLGLVAGTLVAVWKKPAVGFLGCWFFAFLSVTSLVPGTTQMIVEHRMYLPLAAVLVGVVLAVHTWMGNWSRVVFVLAGGAFVMLTVQRNEDYRTELAIWHDTVTKRPRNALAHEMYAQALDRAGRNAAAIAHHETALQLFPGFFLAHTNLGDDLARLGRRADAIAHYEAALRLRPDFADAHNGLGVALAGEGRLADAVAHLGEALRIKPDFPEAHYNLANALVLARRAADAIAHYREALRLRPDYFEAHYNLANTLAEIGRRPEAIAEYEIAVRLRPGHSEARYNLGNTLALSGRQVEAIPQYEAALRLKPDYVEACNNLGSALLDLGRRTEAIARYEEALRINPRFSDARENLARVRALPLSAPP